MIQIVLIFLVFAFIHSITVTLWFKQLCRRAFGDAFMRVWYRFLYNLVSVLTVAIAFRLIRHVPDTHLWAAPPAVRWTMQAVRVAAAMFGALSFRHLDGMEFLGLRQIWRYFTGSAVTGNLEGLTGGDLVTNGVYGIVRHPLYVAGILIMTVDPHITVNGLTVTVLADLYFLFGMFIEERRFVRMFGEPYRAYMQKVPRMIPTICPGRKR